MRKKVDNFVSNSIELHMHMQRAENESARVCVVCICAVSDDPIHRRSIVD